MNAKNILPIMMLLVSSSSFSSSYFFRASATGTTSWLGDTCEEILENGNSSGDGNYLVDPDGDGGNSPKYAYCLMSAGGFMLYDSFSNETGFLGSSPKAYNKRSINDLTGLYDAGYSAYMTDINNSKYEVNDTYFQFYYSSSKNGYISKTLPSWISKIRVDISNEWYFNPSYVYFGGNTIELEGNEKRKELVMSGTGYLKIYEEGIVFLDALWVK